MSEKLRPALWFATMLLLGLAWLKWVHDPSVRATEKLREQTQHTDSSSHQTDTRVARLAADSFQRESELARLDAKLRGARGEIARLKTLVIPSRGGRLAEPQPASRNAVEPVDKTASEAEPAPPVDLLQQIAIRDTIIQEQDSALTAVRAELTIWKALAQERGQLLSQALGERDQYKSQLVAWQKIAQPSILTKIARVTPWIAGGLVLGRVLR